ncbi:cation:proton antiporter [Streptomyces sp. NPDC002644]
MGHIDAFLLVMAASALAPLLAFAGMRVLRVPVVIFEIGLGILLGPDVLDWVRTDEVLDTLSELGLAMLIFLAGYELDLVAAGGGTVRRAVASWLLALGIGVGAATVLSGGEVHRGLVIGTALTTTALGTVLPILADNGQLGGRFGTVMLSFGAVGEFGPVIAVSLFLSGRRPLDSALVLVGFALVTAAAVWWASRPRTPWFRKVAERTVHSSGHFAVRLVTLLLAAMLALSAALGLDVLLGAFAAGVVAKLLLSGTSPDTRRTAMSKVEAMGFGFLVPLFFVISGVEFDLGALLSGGRALLLVPVFLALFLLVRGLPVFLLAPGDLARPERRALALYSSTCLPMVVAITTIGVEGRSIGTEEAAALVGAAMISVLVLPLLALRLSGRADDRTARRPSDADF